MESVSRFNGLNGVEVSRSELLEIIQLAKLEEQHHIKKKLTNVLLQNSDETFTLEILNPGIETIPVSMLNGLQFDDSYQTDPNGLQKAVSPDEIYKTVTDLILNTIQEVGFLPWQKEWKGTGLPTARNYVTEQPYTGINAVTLPYDTKIVNGKLVIIEPKEKDIYYLTFNQIKELGATLKAGSKGRIVTYFNFVFNYNDTKKDLRFNTVNATDFSKFAKKNKISEADMNENLEKYPILKYYNVFKATDCTNLPAKKPKPVNAEPIEIAEKIIELYPNSPKIVIGQEERAFYRGGGSDTVFMPKITAFSSESYYYSTFFHELIHSTGSHKRLDRNMTGKFGNADYAFEELIAELGAVFLCAETGILFKTIENSAKYLKNWNARLVGKMKEDKRFFFKAAAMAQKGVNYILDLNDEREPAYRKHFENQKAKETVKKAAAKKEKPATAKVENVPNGQKMAKERPNYSRKRKYIPKPKVDKNGQTALFGADGLKGYEVENVPEAVEEIAVEEKTITVQPQIVVPIQPAKTISKNPNVQKIGSTNDAAPSEFYTIDGEIGKYFQQVEKKPVHSVVITLDGEQGAGKTTMLYKIMNAFALPGNNCLFISGEEHPTSSLATKKTADYISPAAKQYIDTIGEVANVEELYALIALYDIIFIDSWQKLLRMVGTIQLDEDLRKRFHGKVFVIIFQQTTTGRTKGGAEVVFDGDIITKLVKMPRFADNYSYFDKNRYTLVPLETIRYNVASGTIYNPEEPTVIEEPKLSFTAIEI